MKNRRFYEKMDVTDVREELCMTKEERGVFNFADYMLSC